MAYSIDWRNQAERMQRPMDPSLLKESGKRRFDLLFRFVIIGSIDGDNQGFGQDSDFQRGLNQLLQQTNDTESSVKTLADYLNKHPQALLLGRSGQ